MKSCGTLLKSRREELGVSLEEASHMLGIGVQYLAALEEDQEAMIPGEVYAKRFMEQYAHWLGIPDVAVLFEERLHNQQRDIIHPKHISEKELIVFPRFIRYTTAGFGVCLFVGYLLWQVYSVVLPPIITISSPAQITHTKEVSISGVVENARRVLVNNTEVSVSAGAFTKAVPLVPGLNSIRVRALNRLGKESIVVVSVYYAKEVMRPISQISLR